jgi:hypothetical protein
LCAELRPSAARTTAEQEEARLNQAVKTVLRLFHHWGVVFVLKHSGSSSSSSAESDEEAVGACGDIVLNPQSLADVFKCVITCHTSTAGDESRKELFRQGVLSHSLIESVWSGYEPRLCSQFLRLLHDSELCFELFDSQGNSTHRSLVPSLLPAIAVRGDDETEIRKKLFAHSPSLCPSPSETTKRLHHGYVELEFD